MDNQRNLRKERLRSHVRTRPFPRDHRIKGKVLHTTGLSHKALFIGCNSSLKNRAANSRVGRLLADGTRDVWASWAISLGESSEVSIFFTARSCQRCISMCLLMCLFMPLFMCLVTRFPRFPNSRASPKARARSISRLAGRPVDGLPHRAEGSLSLSRSHDFRGSHEASTSGPPTPECQATRASIA